MAPRSSLFALAAAAIPLAGCINTDAAVFVEATVATPEMTVTPGALGATLEGSFVLKLHLGPRASGPSSVTLGAASITDESQKTEIIASLVTSSATTFPVTVELDSDVDVPIDFDTGKKLLTTEEESGLCSGNGVVIRGAITDSLQNKPTPFVSAVVKPSGCM